MSEHRGAERYGWRGGAWHGGVSLGRLSCVYYAVPVFYASQRCGLRLARRKS